MLLMEDVPTKRRNVRWFRAATRWHEENTLHIPNAVVRRRMSDALKSSARHNKQSTTVWYINDRYFTASFRSNFSGFSENSSNEFTIILSS